MGYECETSRGMLTHTSNQELLWFYEMVLTTVYFVLNTLCLVLRHQNGHKVMFVKDVVVLSSGILKLCGTRKQLVSDRYII